MPIGVHSSGARGLEGWRQEHSCISEVRVNYVRESDQAATPGVPSTGALYLLRANQYILIINMRLEERVVRAAEAALARQQYVSAIDVLCGMGLLMPTHVDSWRKGRVDYLERVIQGNLSKISTSMAMFHRWAQDKGLKPSETGYVRRTRSGKMHLQFSKSGEPAIEKSYRTHYVSPALSEAK